MNNILKRKITDTIHLNNVRNIYKKFKSSNIPINIPINNSINLDSKKKLKVENKKRKSRNNTPKNDNINNANTNSNTNTNTNIITLIPNKQNQNPKQHSIQHSIQHTNKKYITSQLSNPHNNQFCNPHKKEQIPKRIREMVWNTYNSEKYSNKCYVSWCNNIINVFNYQVGHDIPESKGGTLDLSNLKPICGNCNLSMGNKYTITEWCKLIEDSDTHKKTNNQIEKQKEQEPEPELELQQEHQTKTTEDIQIDKPNQIANQIANQIETRNNNLTFMATILMIIMHLMYI